MDLPRYELVNDRFVWRFDSEADKVGRMLFFVFDPDDAMDVVAMMNAAIAMSVVMIPNEWDPPDASVRSKDAHVSKMDAHVSKMVQEEQDRLRMTYGARDPKELIVTKEEMGTLASGGILNDPAIHKLYTWDGETNA